MQSSGGKSTAAGNRKLISAIGDASVAEQEKRPPVLRRRVKRSDSHFSWNDANSVAPQKIQPVERATSQHQFRTERPRLIEPGSDRDFTRTGGTVL